MRIAQLLSTRLLSFLFFPRLHLSNRIRWFYPFWHTNARPNEVRHRKEADLKALSPLPIGAKLGAIPKGWHGPEPPGAQAAASSCRAEGLSRGAPLPTRPWTAARRGGCRRCWGPCCGSCAAAPTGARRPARARGEMPRCTSCSSWSSTAAWPGRSSWPTPARGSWSPSTTPTTSTSSATGAAVAPGSRPRRAAPPRSSGWCERPEPRGGRAQPRDHFCRPGAPSLAALRGGRRAPTLTACGTACPEPSRLSPAELRGLKVFLLFHRLCSPRRQRFGTGRQLCDHSVIPSITPQPGSLQQVQGFARVKSRSAKARWVWARCGGVY